MPILAQSFEAQHRGIRAGARNKGYGKLKAGVSQVAEQHLHIYGFDEEYWRWNCASRAGDHTP